MTFAGQDLHSRDFINYDFRRCDLTGTCFFKSNLTNSNLLGAHCGVISYISSLVMRPQHLKVCTARDLVAIGVSPTTVKVFQALTREIVSVFNGAPKTKLHTLEFSPDGRTIAVAQNSISIVEVDTGQVVSVVESSGVVETLAYSPDGTHLASLSFKGHVQLIDVVSVQILKRLTLNVFGGQSLQFCDDKIVTLSTLGEICWLHPDSSIQRQKIPQFPKNKVILAPNGRLIAFTRHVREVILVDCESEVEIRKFECGEVKSKAFSQDSSILFAGCSDGAFYLWRVETGQIIKQVRGYIGPIEFIRVWDSADKVAFCDVFGQVIVYQIPQ